METNKPETRKPETKTPDTEKPGSKLPGGGKSKAAHLALCNKCGGEIFRSSFRHFGEVIIAPLVQPFRCSRCGWRQFRLSFSRAKDKNDYRREATDRE
jgi:hypothetical protein